MDGLSWPLLSFTSVLFPDHLSTPKWSISRKVLENHKYGWVSSVVFKNTHLEGYNVTHMEQGTTTVKIPPFFSAENTFVMIAGQNFEDGNNSSCWSLYPYIFSIPLFLSTFIDLTDALTHVFPGIFLLMQDSISAWAMRSNRNHVAFSHYFLKNGTVKMSEPLSYARITWDPCCICCFYLPYRVCVVSL